jgi:hypothetical protein
MGAIAITCPSRGYLKKCISKSKSPEHPSHHLIREMQLFLEKLSCDGKIQSAKGGDQQDEDENRKDVPSNVRWMLIRQFISLSQHGLICPLENRSEETANETEKSASDSAGCYVTIQRESTADPEREGKYRPYNRTNASVFRLNLLSDRFQVKQKLILF